MSDKPKVVQLRPLTMDVGPRPETLAILNEIVDLLNAGKIVDLAFVAVGPGGVALKGKTPTSHGEAMYTGLHMLAADCMDEMRESTEAPGAA